MSEKTMLSVKGLSKKYVIQHAQEKPADTIRDLLTSKVKDVFRRSDDSQKPEEFWALKDVSFELGKGQTLGIIGRNGAGKSTLLKIISRVIEPTEGEIVINGRIASLLEVGTGFHPELSGRENVYFNGSLLGMSKSEIDAKFDEIVEFSEIQRFIDTPVKFYSSGMMVRLAFSIAAHLEPEILVIDEALSVGDVAFQKKSLDKMRSAAASGRTILFVSHAMDAVQDLCDQVMYLDEGHVKMIGTPEATIDAYLGSTRKNFDTVWKADTKSKPVDKRIIPKKMTLLASNGKRLPKSVDYSESITARLEFDLEKATKDVSVGISLFDDYNNRLFRTSITDVDEKDRISLSKGKNVIEVDIPTENLKEGAYLVVFDGDIFRQGWVVNPYHTDAKTRFNLARDDSRPLPWDSDREGLTKPILSWRKIS